MTLAQMESTLVAMGKRCRKMPDGPEKEALRAEYRALHAQWMKEKP